MSFSDRVRVRACRHHRRRLRSALTPLPRRRRYSPRVQVIGAMTQGGVAAVIGAALGATTEPVVNKVLVQRVTLSEALASFSATKALNFFLTATLPTNLLKYPFYEVVNMLLSTVDLPDTGKGVIIGAVFTTVTLPLGSYRCVGAARAARDEGCGVSVDRLLL